MRHNIVHRGARPAVVRDNAQECVDVIAAMVFAINAKAIELYNA
jgi:hypothetical protein